ncbi:hypothetical protein GCM10009092_22600 [Bowmanella denitrificans]|uniref:Methylamine utilization protein MauE n=1 Tax=Bowmanella denitrificans TaxID=366582 RepID=A0ABN0X8V4_9ALTE
MIDAVYISELIRCMIGLLFLQAAWSKSRDMSAFRGNLHETFAVPVPLANWLGPALALIEGAVAITMLSNWLGYWSMLCASLMLTFFTLRLAWPYLQGDLIRCHCFGSSQRPVSAFDLLRNLLLIGLTVTYLLNPVPPSLPLSELLLLAALALALNPLLMHFHELMEILRDTTGVKH